MEPYWTYTYKNTNEKIELYKASGKIILSCSRVFSESFGPLIKKHNGVLDLSLQMGSRNAYCWVFDNDEESQHQIQGLVTEVQDKEIEVPLEPESNKSIDIFKKVQDVLKMIPLDSESESDDYVLSENDDMRTFMRFGDTRIDDKNCVIWIKTARRNLRVYQCHH